MTEEKTETLNRLKHEMLFKAFTRHDNSSIYIFLHSTEVSGKKYNLLITDAGKGMRNALYRFHEEGDRCFIFMEDRDYEILLPDKISDEEPLSFQLKDPDGNTILFDDYF